MPCRNGMRTEVSMVETKRRKLNDYHQHPNKIHVGKSLLIRSLKKNHTDQIHGQIRGPITIVSGNRRLIQIVECPNNMNGMIDAAKFEDARILLVDANYGFEKDTFEFLNLLQVHGMPKVMGVLTHLDELEDAETRKIMKERLMDKFRTNIHERARICCFSGLHHGMYQKNETDKLENFLSVLEFHTFSWRAVHPYLLVDHFEDVTSLENVRMDRKCKRDIILYDYLRGCDIKKVTKVHIAGVGDYPSADATLSADLCPLPPVDGNEKQRQINIERSDIDKEPHLEIETVTNHDPCQPILVGGVSCSEENVGQKQVHIAGVGDYPLADVTLLADLFPLPLVDSNDKQMKIEIEHNNIDKEPRLEIEMVTNHDPCQPILVGGASSAEDNVGHMQEPVSILGTADVLDFNPTSKKIKPTGTPSLILNETALMRDMLMSDNEVTDVKIKTAHGIDGEVIKVIGAYNGTTYIAVINKTGLYFIVDGLSYLLIDTDTPEKIRNITREKPHKLNCPKLFQLGKEMLASVQGSNFWSNHILDVIKPKVEKYKGWRLPKQCAEETHRILKEHVFTEDDLVKQGFPKDYDMSKAGCGIVFGAYIDDQEKGRVPSMYYADRYNCLEVIDADRYDGTIAKINDNDKIRVGYICRGSGG